MAHHIASVDAVPSSSQPRLGSPTPVALAVAGFLWGCTSGPAWAQASPAPVASLPTVTVSTQNAAPTAPVTGFGDEDLQRTPMQVNVIDQETLKTHAIRRVSEVLQRDASASDAYNAIGYWDHVTLRGFVLDNTYNHRRDGLPISAETSLSLENRESIELLKGTTGIQAGTSAPGGLVNHTIKRPPANTTPMRQLRVEANAQGGWLTHVDLGGRFGVDNAMGYRLNVAGERLRSPVSHADGHRHVVALAFDWRLRPGSVLDVELEHSRRSQPGVPGLSLLGTQLPPADPRLNINQQPWSQSGLMQGLTGSVRYEQAIDTDWRWSIHLARQALKANDFLAYPYGCYAATTDTYYADRYCPNGDFDLYDFRSLNERRTMSSVQLKTDGRLQTGPLTHHLSVGLLQTRYSERGQPQADNNAAVGTGNLYTMPALPADPTFTDPYTQRTERSTELFAHDRLAWNAQWSTWVGLRHSRIERDSIRTDGSRATAYRQSFTTPWLALAWQWQPSTLFYASTGQGVESQVAPGRSRYTNAGQPLPALKSRQWEVGIKHQWNTGHAQATVFRITRPRAGDAGACDVSQSCTLQMDGDDRHQGLELSAREKWGALTLDTSVMWLSAQRRNGHINPSLNGLRPTNVPDWVLRATASYAVPQVPGLSAHVGLSHEGRRAVVPDGSIELPSWSRVDAGVSYKTRLSGGQMATWRMNIKNVFNRRYFQESPYQYSHIYLFPAAPRTVTFGWETAF